MDSVISIFGVEHFKVNSCLSRNMDKNACLESIGPKGPIGSTAPVAPSESEPEEVEDPTLDQLSSYLGKNNAVIEQKANSYDYKTKREFELLYFPETMTKQEKKLMVKVFRFIFGTKESSIDHAILQKLLTPFDKLPCNEDKQEVLSTLLKECLTYRTEGLNTEITNLRGIVPHSQEYKSKYYLRAQLLRMVEVLDEKGRSCVVFSNTGGELFLSEYHTAILKLIRETVRTLLHEKLPTTDEEKDARLKELLKGIEAMTQTKGDNKQIFEDMLGIVRSVFDKMKTIDKDVDTLAEMMNLDDLFPAQGAATQAGGGPSADADAEAEAEEEYERVFTTAMGHLDGMPKGHRAEFLEAVNEVLMPGGKDLETSIGRAVERKGFSLSTTMSRLRDIDTDKHGKSFLRCVETLLELKESQMNVFEAPPDLPPKERYSYTMSKYPSLKEYLPKDILRRGSLTDLEKKLRRIYPYTETLIEDIKAIRKTPDPCTLFYKGLCLMMPKKARTICKKLVDTVPRCKELVEEVLVACQVPVSEGLLFKEVTLPKGFWAIAGKLRKIPSPGLPITIHEEPPKSFQKVMGEHPFILVGTGTVLKGLKGMEIDIGDDSEEIRKGEVSIGAVLFLYLYIMCDSHIDA
jgi:hypothetical protein